MKIAIISDIHSNFTYLQSVFKKIIKEQVDRIYCLGDLVGYYDKPNEVISFIKDNNITCIKGNHEKYILKELKYDVKLEYIYGFKKQRKKITKDNLYFLKELKDEITLRIDRKEIYMTHSLPNNSEKYIYSAKDIDSDFIKKYDYYCFGHTHIPLVMYQYGTCILNPGSVGQPRDYTKKPSYVIIDFSKDVVKIQKVTINNDKYLKKIKQKGYNMRLIQILEREKNGNY